MAMANSAFLPAGWVRDVPNQQYRGPNGEIITEMDIVQHGTFDDALLSRYGVGDMKIHRYRPHNPKVGDVVASAGLTEIYTNHGWVTNHNITNAGAANMVNNGTLPSAYPTSISSTQPASTLSFETDHGRVELNIKTGDLTIPGGMGRQDAIREFWLGFQEHFGTVDVIEYKSEIVKLKGLLEAQKEHAKKSFSQIEKEAAKKVAEKIAAKYRGEKFIMVKPDDLIKFIESEE